LVIASDVNLTDADAVDLLTGNKPLGVSILS